MTTAKNVDIAYGLPTGCVHVLPRAQYRPYIHIVTDMEYTWPWPWPYVSVFRSNVTACGTYVHATDCIFSAGKGRACNGQVGGATVARPMKTELDKIFWINAFGGEASMYDICTLGQSG